MSEYYIHCGFYYWQTWLCFLQAVVVTEVNGRQRRRYVLRGTREVVVEDEVLTREEQASNLVDAFKG